MLAAAAPVGSEQQLAQRRREKTAQPRVKQIPAVGGWSESLVKEEGAKGPECACSSSKNVSDGVQETGGRETTSWYGLRAILQASGIHWPGRFPSPRQQRRLCRSCWSEAVFVLESRRRRCRLAVSHWHGRHRARRRFHVWSNQAPKCSNFGYAFVRLPNRSSAVTGPLT